MLREVIIRKASENVKVLFDRGEFVDLLQTHGDFAIEVLRCVVFDSESRQEAVAYIQRVQARGSDSVIGKACGSYANIFFIFKPFSESPPACPAFTIPS
jgi:hypothetical protein